MSYAIVCDSQHYYPNQVCGTLALVDRSIVRDKWWTSNNSYMVRKFPTMESAQRVLNKLEFNYPKIVEHCVAKDIIEQQQKALINHESKDWEVGWDAHKQV